MPPARMPRLSIRCARMNCTLDLPLFGDVGVDRQDRLGLSVLVAQEPPAALDDHFLAVLGDMLKFARPLAGLQRERMGLTEILRIGVDKLTRKTTGCFVAGPPVDALRALIPKQNAAFRIEK